MKQMFMKYVVSCHAIDEPNTSTWWHTSDWLPADQDLTVDDLLDLHLKSGLP